ncbi:uncharacterized protein PHALS_07716 [Plasmopara halstedii]|uniref:Uncharacterized protein n=1 Tax=Plasmopara halstedii TaxID=4781 RepID=A0A0P1B7Y6_PLAHL|nr:uncharacterized protein PHALS_07716 [Plasmopara halstedii]CEG49983.1 hypothetical protein PHALS_07716 [Plasmopara halstedii]|eukprot:XP_024586352.1 hypothetical protein PHALS_07716 [Plasmopara halstedii]
MVSSRRSVSPSSSFSSYDSTCSQEQANEAPVDNSSNFFNGLQHVNVDQDREVARRALADLVKLYFDEDSDYTSDDDECGSCSEIESRMSSQSSQNPEESRGMTLEELSVAVNAAIEHHRPTKPAVVQVACKTKGNDSNDVDQKSDNCCSRRSCQYQQKSHTASSLEMFQDMLERKMQQFYSRRAVDSAAKDKCKSSQDTVVKAFNGAAQDEGRKSRDASTSCNYTVDQQQQTTICVRDQATETEEMNNHYPLSELITPIQSMNTQHSADLSTQSIIDGPTLADLHFHNGQYQRDRLTTKVFASKSSWGSFSSSVDAACFSSSASEHSVACSVGSNTNIKSSITGRRTHSRKVKDIPSRALLSSRSSDQHQSDLASVETKQPNDWQFSQAQNKRIDEVTQTSVVDLSADTIKVPSNPENVKWELDLSNFAL